MMLTDILVVLIVVAIVVVVVVVVVVVLEAGLGEGGMFGKGNPRVGVGPCELHTIIRKKPGKWI